MRRARSLNFEVADDKKAAEDKKAADEEAIDNDKYQEMRNFGGGGPCLHIQNDAEGKARS